MIFDEEIKILDDAIKKIDDSILMANTYLWISIIALILFPIGLWLFNPK